MIKKAIKFLYKVLGIPYELLKYVLQVKNIKFVGKWIIDAIKESIAQVFTLLGFEEETAAEDVEIIAEQAVKEEAVAEAVEEYVERAIENSDVENYTLADTVTEVQVELFLENPVGQLLDVNIGELDISSLGDDMTSDQREKAQEVVVPVILASQIIAQAGAVLRRF